MKGIVHGILRSLVALAYVYTLYNYASALARFGALSFNSDPILYTYWVAILLILCVIIYMGVNCVREFMQKRISLRPLFVIVAILTLVALLAVAMRVSSTSARRPVHITDLISYVTLALMLYFSIVDFIELFVKKKEETFYTDSDFEGADEK